jgi:DNA replication protein
MYRFTGFPEGKTHLTPIPDLFFSEILPNIDHLGVIKLLLNVFWLLDQMEGSFRYILREDLMSNEQIASSFGTTDSEAQQHLTQSLGLAVDHNILLEIEINIDGTSRAVYFLNSPKGRAALKAIERGEWRPTGDPWTPLEIAQPSPNIFRLYEENIGPLTPLIADALTEAEGSYPEKWIEDAFRIAVEKNNRNWRYIAAILERWKQKGKYERKDRRDTEEARR